MKCDRCSRETPSITMSMFNTELVCEACEAEEKGHPKYGEACEVERQAVLGGDYNFPGIGLPMDLQRAKDHP